MVGALQLWALSNCGKPRTEPRIALHSSLAPSPQIVLTETMRQAPDEAALLERLLRIRCGEVTQQDWRDVLARDPAKLSKVPRRLYLPTVPWIHCTLETSPLPM